MANSPSRHRIPVEPGDRSASSLQWFFIDECRSGRAQRSIAQPARFNRAVTRRSRNQPKRGRIDHQRHNKSDGRVPHHALDAYSRDRNNRHRPERLQHVRDVFCHGDSHGRARNRCMQA